MPKFTYTGEDKNGTPVKQTVEAADRFGVYEIARTNGHVVKSVDESKKFSPSAFLDMDKINYYLSKVKDDDLVMMTRNLGSMLVAGLPLSRGLSVIERQSKNPRLQGIMKQVRERINQGDQFHEALKAFPESFDDLYVSMVKAGEESGGLADTLPLPKRSTFAGVTFSNI
jgi:type II secretory pathway component PulF